MGKGKKLFGFSKQQDDTVPKIETESLCDRESVASVSTSTDDLRINSYYYNSQNPQQTREPVSEVNQVRASILRDKVICRLCQDTKDTNDNYIILPCKHVYHIKCLYNEYYTTGPVIDKEYIESRVCLTCNTQVPQEDLLFLHSKFLACSKDDMVVYDNTINKLEEQLKKVKDELSKSYDARQRIQLQRERCKQIVNNITLLM